MASPEITTLLLLRLAFLAVLYLFLVLVARAAWRELRPAAAAPRRLLVVIDPARTSRPPGDRILIADGAAVGRDAGSAVALDEDTVSARHAVFQCQNGRWWIEDLGSTNGTFINRRRISGRARLNDGDEVQFGRVALRFEAA